MRYNVAGVISVNKSDTTDYTKLGQQLIELADIVCALTGAKVIYYEMTGLLNKPELFGKHRENMVTHRCDYCRYMLNQPGGRFECIQHHFGTPSNRLNAVECEKPHWVKCYAGLEEYSVPMMYNDKLIALAYIGQVRFDDQLSYIPALPFSVDETKINKLYNKLAKADKEKIESVARLFELAMSAVLQRFIPSNEIELYLMREESSIVDKALAVFSRNFESGYSVNELAQSLCVDSKQLSHKFKLELGMSLQEFLTARRIALARRLIKEGSQSINSIAVNCGFKDADSFIHWFKRNTNETIGSYKTTLSGIKLSNRSLDYTEAVKQIIESEWREPITVDTLSERLGITPDHLTRVFKAQTGFTVYTYVQKVRLEHAKSELIKTDAPVAHIALDNGYSTPSSFTATFARETGMTPLEFRKQKKNS